MDCLFFQKGWYKYGRGGDKIMNGNLIFYLQMI